MSQVIVVGGGLSGLSAAHTVLENGGRVMVIDKNPFFGGNSTKATSGINGALTRTQIAKGIKDSPEIFLQDTCKGGKGTDPWPLARVLCYNSASGVEWLMDRFNLDLSLVSRLGGHSNPRTHRGKERFPGMTITYALMEKLEDIAQKQPHRARVVTKARVFELIRDDQGRVNGVEYEKDGKTFKEYGPVVLATGGYAADFSENSLLKKHRPDLLHLPTTNGDHCTGDGIKLSEGVGGDTVDLNWVQVHPTGLVHPDEPNAKVKFLAAEALRGVGGLLLDADGKRFCNELGTRDYVSGEMTKNKGPFRLVLNSKASKEIEWHCKHYVGRKLMKKYNNANELAADMKIPASRLQQTFDAFNEGAKTGNDAFGMKYFSNGPWVMEDHFHVAVVTPVLHYCMGGLKCDTNGSVLSRADSKPVPGLFACGEVMGGVHGKNRLGGSSLLDCVVFGRVSGASATRFLLSNVLQDISTGHVASAPLSTSAPGVRIEVDPQTKRVSVLLGGSESAAATTATATATTATSAPSSSGSSTFPTSDDGYGGGRAAATTTTTSAAPAQRAITLEEVAKHNTENDCWVVVNGQVLNVTSFLKDHPGGKQAILLFAGRDASAEFNMLHKPDVVAKYAPDTIIGTLAGASSISTKPASGQLRSKL